MPMAGIGLYMCCSERMLLVILLECKLCEDGDFVLCSLSFLHLPHFLPLTVHCGAEWPGEQPVRVFSMLFDWFCFFPDVWPPSSQPSVLDLQLGRARPGGQAVVHYLFS